MRPLDIFDAPHESDWHRERLRECDLCPPGCYEQEPGEFAQCEKCDIRFCAPRHAAHVIPDICSQCEQELRTCAGCGGEDVDTREVQTERGPDVFERRCSRCNPKAWATQEAWEGRYEAI